MPGFIATYRRRAIEFFDRNGDGRRQGTEPKKTVTGSKGTGRGPDVLSATLKAQANAGPVPVARGWKVLQSLPPATTLKKQ